MFTYGLCMWQVSWWSGLPVQWVTFPPYPVPPTITPLKRQQILEVHTSTSLQSKHISLCPLHCSRQWVGFGLNVTVCYATTTSLRSGRLPVAYCNAYFSTQTENETSMKIDVFSYRRAHRRASCSSGSLCGCFGAIMCDTQLSNVLKTSWTPYNTRNFTQHWHCTVRSVLFSLCK
jgi:hypothetical protein